MQQYSNNLTDAAGNAIPFASVTVYDENGAKAQLFSDKDGTQPIDNPVPCDVLGRFAFHAKNGRYYPVVEKTGIAPVDIGEILLFDSYNAVTALADVQQSMEEAIQIIASDTGTDNLGGTWFGGVLAKVSGLASSIGASLIGFIQAGTGAVARSVQDELRDTISVKQFGAKGDGVTNDSAAITAADAKAKLLGKTLLFPSGTYMAYGLLPTAPWVSIDGATIKNNQPASDYSSFVRATSASGITSWECENITFDGAASADPVGGWTSGNFDSFTGSFGLFLYGLTSFSLRRVKAQNAANGAGIRIAGCSNGVLDRCETKRTRGKYGDGIYIDSSSNIKVLKPRCSDFTRIGVVTENGCSEIDISDGMCRDGHDASILYGGTEYNAGYWSENTATVRRTRCTSINSLSANTAYRHFVNATGTVSGYTRGMHSDAQCSAYGFAGETGFIAYSLGTMPLTMRRSLCVSVGCDSAFADEANNDTDSFVNDTCHAAFPLASSGFQSGFQWMSQSSFTRAPLFQYMACTTEYTAMPAGAQTALDNSSSNTADFSTFQGGFARVRLISCHNIDSTLPLYLKQNTGTLDLLIENGVVAPFVSNSINKVRFKNVQMTGSSATLYYINGSADFESVGSSFGARIQLGTTGNIILEGGQVKMPTACYLLIQRTLNSARPALQISNVRFEKDIASGDYVLRIQELGTLKPGLIMTGCTFYNSGASTSTNSFIWIVSAISAFQLSGNMSDSTVTNLYKLNTTLQANPTGNTQVTMH